MEHLGGGKSRAVKVEDPVDLGGLVDPGSLGISSGNTEVFGPEKHTPNLRHWNFLGIWKEKTCKDGGFQDSPF